MKLKIIFMIGMATACFAADRPATQPASESIIPPDSLRLSLQPQLAPDVPHEKLPLRITYQYVHNDVDLPDDYAWRLRAHPAGDLIDDRH